MSRTTASAATPTRARVPVPVYILALTVFCLGTSEFMIAGLLPQLSRDLRVDVPAAGGLISAFAVGMLVGAPVMALLTIRLPRRLTLIAAAAVFALAHLVVLVTDVYAVVLVSRVLAAVACATFWAVGAITTVAIAPREVRARALGVLVGGLTAANVLGVPAGTWIGELLGWRAAFVVVAAATVVATVATVLRVPETRPDRGERLGVLAARELRGLRNPRLLVALATTAASQAAFFATFSYLSVILIRVAGIPEPLIAAVLLVFGLGTLLGIAVGSRVADRDPLLNVAVSVVATAAALVLLIAVARNPVLAVGAVILFGIAGFSIASALNARVFLHADEAPTLASGVNVSAFNVGNAIGPWLGGLAIAAGLPLLAPIGVSLGLLAIALGLAGVSWLLERRRAVVSAPQPECPACPA